VLALLALTASPAWADSTIVPDPTLTAGAVRTTDASVICSTGTLHGQEHGVRWGFGSGQAGPRLERLGIGFCPPTKRRAMPRRAHAHPALTCCFRSITSLRRSTSLARVTAGGWRKDPQPLADRLRDKLKRPAEAVYWTVSGGWWWLFVTIKGACGVSACAAPHRPTVHV
jgi:hypothetical protein